MTELQFWGELFLCHTTLAKWFSI